MKYILATFLTISFSPDLFSNTKYSYLSKDGSKEYHVIVPSEHEGLLKSHDGSPNLEVLGEGSMGIVFKVQYQGEIQTLKYFKNKNSEFDYFEPKTLKEYERVASEYVKNPAYHTGKGETVDIFTAGGAAEDVVFSAQQKEERTGFEQRKNEAFSMPRLLGTGWITVTPVTIFVRTTDLKGKKALSPSESLARLSEELLDINLLTEARMEKMGYRKVTALIKPLIPGKNLRKLIEADNLNSGMVRAIIHEIAMMSKNGLFYEDLNEANWFIYEFTDEFGFVRYVAIPFDMKPGKYVGSPMRAFKKNCKSITSKTSPMGATVGFFRNTIVWIKQLEISRIKKKAGLFHAKIGHKNKSVKLLIEALNQAMRPYRNKNYR